MKRGATALLVHPCDVAPLTSIINECVDAGIPVIVLNLLQFRDGGDLRATAYIGFDNHVAGALAAYACVDYLGGPGCIGKSKWGSAGSSTPIDVEWYSSRTKASEAGNVHGRVVIIEGVPGSFTSSQRVEGFKSIISRYKGICLHAIHPGMWNEQISAEITRQVLDERTTQPLDLIWAACNDMAYGVINVLEHRGLL